jgi:NTP pyrophosphatase (non-canonical NTP hydrolase)
MTDTTNTKPTTTLTLQEFIPNAIRTESVVPSIQFNFTQFWSIMDAAIAVGELADIVKKSAFYNKRIDVAEWNSLIIKASAAIHSIQTTPGVNVNPVDVGIENTRLFHAGLGMFTESVEMLQAIDKATMNGESVDIVNFGEELGDSEYYQAIAYDELDMDPERVMATIINKLKHRYPDKFDNTNAINRDLLTERAILETGFSQPSVI